MCPCMADPFVAVGWWTTSVRLSAVTLAMHMTRPGRASCDSRAGRYVEFWTACLLVLAKQLTSAGWGYFTGGVGGQ
jgi:hypothetical protein